MKYFTEIKADSVFEGIKYNDKIAKGTVEAIITDPILIKDIDKCKSTKQEKDSKARQSFKKEEPDYDIDIQKAILAAAAYRDIRYSLVGRKYMRVSALVGNNVGLFHRVQGLARLDNYRKSDLPVSPENKPKDFTE